MAIKRAFLLLVGACALVAASGTVPAQKSRGRSSEARETRENRDSRDSREVPTATIRGRITLVAGRRQTVSPEEISQTVIYFLPEGGSPAPAPKRLSTTTYTKGFEPNLLVTTVGSTVTFPNRDTIIHNVYSATPGSSFALGSFGPGEVKSHRFDKPGLVVVNCNVHRGMRANVLVLATPYSAQARADGSFSLVGVPVGPGMLVIWHPRVVAESVAWNGRGALVVDRTLVATRARIGGS